MKFIDDIMDAMGIVDEVEVEEAPHKSREERMAKAEAAKAAKIADEAKKARALQEEQQADKPSTTDKIKSFFGKKEEAEPAVEAKAEEQEEKAAPVRRRLNFAFPKNKETAAEEPKAAPAPVAKPVAMPKASEPVRRAPVAYNTGAVNMQMIEPTSFDDSQRVADCLHNNQPVIVNFEHTDPIIAKRMTDFISGTIYALQGNMKKIGRNILICAPKNVDIDNGLGFDDRGRE